MKNTQKKLILTILVLLASKAFAYTGLMADEDKLYTTSTVWFDIIYPASSREYASHLAENADRIYEEICDNYEIRIPERITVTITPETDVFNAYETNQYKTHIVLFDTVPDEEMMVQSDNMLGTFTHELNHAVTSLWDVNGFGILNSIYGDFVSPYFFTTPVSLIEGSSVAKESINGEGRLNYGFYTQIIKQIKLNGNFPSWQSSLGNSAKNITYGQRYAVGGPFTKYLQDTYGMEKYSALFWQLNAAEMNALTLNSIFKKVYGKNLDEIWQGFHDSIKVPEVKSNPLEEGFVKDFFNMIKNKDTARYSIENNRESSYADITVSKNAIVFNDSTSYRGYVSYIESDGTLTKPKTLYTKAGDSNVSLSEDGRYLAVSHYGKNYSATKRKVSVFDMKDKSWHELNETGLRDATVIKDGETYYLAAAKTDHQNMYLNFYRIFLNKNGRIKGFEKASSTLIPDHATITSVKPYGDGKAAVIYKKGWKWSIRIYSQKDYVEYNLPEGFELQGLENNPLDKSLTFSYSVNDSFPRLGMLYPDANGNLKLKVQQRDLSGAVYNPVLLNDSIIYIGNFAANTKLLVASLDGLEMKEETVQVSSSSLSNEAKKETASLKGEKPYDNLPMVQTLPFISLGGAMTMDFTGIDQIVGTLLGGTIIMKNPWDGAASLITGGYNPYGSYGILSYSYQTSNSAHGGTNDLNAVFANVVYDEDIFRQASAMLETEYTFVTGNCSKLTLTGINYGFVGKRSNIVNDYYDFYGVSIPIPHLNQDDSNYYFDETALTVSFMQGIIGSGYRDTLGWNASASYTFEVMGSIGALGKNNAFGATEGSNVPFEYAHNVSPTLSLYLPKLLPFDCVEGFSYNLPTQIKTTLVPSYYKLLSGSAETILFKCDIEKAIKLPVPIYLHRFVLAFDYDFYLAHRFTELPISQVAEGFASLNGNSYADSYSLLAVLQAGLAQGFISQSDTSLGFYAGIKYTSMPDKASDTPTRTYRMQPVINVSTKF